MVFERKLPERRFTLLERDTLSVDMLTKEQLSVLARKNGIPLFTQERDYVQVLFLSRLYEHKIPLVFKGGTCLKLVHGSPRFSEDLDFTCLEKPKDIKPMFENALEELRLIGLDGKLNKEKKLKLAVSYRLRYKGPLYTGKPTSMGSIRFDISLRKDMLLDPELSTVSSNYPDAPPFLASCMPIEEIFAEKIRALLKRSKPRDIYDVWFLLNRGVKVDAELINKKIELQGLKFDLKRLKTQIENKRNDWKNDLSPLLASTPDFDGVKNNLIKKLEEIFE